LFPPLFVEGSRSSWSCVLDPRAEGSPMLDPVTKEAPDNLTFGYGDCIRHGYGLVFERNEFKTGMNVDGVNDAPALKRASELLLLWQPMLLHDDQAKISSNVPTIEQTPHLSSPPSRRPQWNYRSARTPLPWRLPTSTGQVRATMRLRWRVPLTGASGESQTEVSPILVHGRHPCDGRVGERLHRSMRADRRDHLGAVLAGTRLEQQSTNSGYTAPITTPSNRLRFDFLHAPPRLDLLCSA
jgi:hypothetical protein